MCGIAKTRPAVGDARNFVGIELETTGGNLTIVSKLIPAAKKAGFLIRADHECHGYYYGYEFSMLAPEDKYKPALKEMIRIAEAAGCICNGNGLGLHVHLDLRNRGGVYRSDAGQRFHERRADILKFPSPDRVRLSSYWSPMTVVGREGYETIEIRCHEATYDFERICKYIDFLLEIINQQPLAKAA